MKKTVGTVVTVVIVLALLVLGIVFGRAALSEQQLGTLKLLLIVCGCSIVYCFTEKSQPRLDSWVNYY